MRRHARKTGKEVQHNLTKTRRERSADTERRSVFPSHSSPRWRADGGRTAIHRARKVRTHGDNAVGDGDEEGGRRPRRGLPNVRHHELHVLDALGKGR